MGKAQRVHAAEIAARNVDTFKTGGIGVEGRGVFDIIDSGGILQHVPVEGTQLGKIAA